MKKNDLTPQQQDAVKQAALCYVRRRDRLEHPLGEFDNAGRWYPDPSEGLDTCRLRSPSRAWPFTYQRACRSLAHCMRLEGVPSEHATEVRREVRRLDLEREARKSGGLAT
jgi:hypothetical protein